MKKRTISAIIMLAIFIPVLIMGDLLFALFISAAAVLGVHELLKTKRLRDKKIPLAIDLFAYILVLFLTLNNYDIISVSYTIDYRLISATLLIFGLPLVFINDTTKYSIKEVLTYIGITLFIGFSFNLIILIRNYSLDYIIYLFLVTIATDTFAYFIGKNIGKNKLAPKISPNKTIEGTIGGTLMAVFIATMYFTKVINSSLNVGVVVFMTVMLSLLGQIGDLFFSFIKREYDIKDFSNLIPGHGGVLDRLDSIIFAVLGFLLFLVIL